MNVTKLTLILYWKVWGEENPPIRVVYIKNRSTLERVLLNIKLK